MTVLRTSRLVMRDLSLDDAAALLSIVNDPDVTRYIPVEPQTLESERSFIAAALAEIHGRHHHFAVVETETTELIGHARVGVADGIGPDLSYMLRKDRWGRGYGTEVARRLVEFAFGVLGHDEIFVTCAPDNEASRHVIAKSGFSFVERRAGHMTVRGAARDSLVFRHTRPEDERLLDQQRTYYDERAPDYMVPTKPADRKGRGGSGEELDRLLIDEFAPTGNILEIACGAGAWTREIVRHADAVTALDGSPRMIERNRQEVASPKVTYVIADVFTWEPDRAYDAVVFSFWLSHVPPDDRFDEFWRRVAAALKPGGRVCFIDEDDRAAVLEDLAAVNDVPVARRTLADGRRFDVVKVLWRCEDLEQRLTSLGWQVNVRPVGDVCLFGVGGLG